MRPVIGRDHSLDSFVVSKANKDRRPLILQRQQLTNVFSFTLGERLHPSKYKNVAVLRAGFNLTPFLPSVRGVVSKPYKVVSEQYLSRR
jgi:hypothetical protein